MLCDNCGKRGARVRRTTRSFGTGKSQFLIEDAPVVHCPQCGESHLTAETLKEIERIRKAWRKLAVMRPVPVATFSGGAARPA